MVRKFTRVEFEGGSVVVVKDLENKGNFQIKGNKMSGLTNILNSQHSSHVEMVDKVINDIGKKVKRRLCHISPLYS
ncbi:hypothetical protein L3Q72_20885 [Vibrio sp. JC009]|uniref:hypothetical protein n=1 Tax=Vibrio sp. JC009 TaxID=2912314 RepID=UPI0023B102A5|nr:hypothetical protein [Vibrio sp. JC009]WED23694.1 hypothetical protein L3Q72_20885 [Vibrio sp. JC009]